MRDLCTAVFHNVFSGLAMCVAASAPLATAADAPVPAEADAPAKSKVQVEHFEPQTIDLSVGDLPKPFATESVKQHPNVVAVPDDLTLKVPEGFAVNVFAEGIEKARWPIVSPFGDVLISCGQTNKIHLLRDTDDDGVSDERHLLLDESNGANLPFGMDFAQDEQQRWWFYLANTDAVWRYPYEKGVLKLTTKPQKITQLPGQGYNQHWTRNLRVAPDGKRLFVTVGSESNVDVEAPPRACVLVMNLDGSDRRVFASGLRNPVGLDFHPESGEVYVNVNERDELGDNLVPDYFTRVEEGGFYGWPYAYLRGDNLDPRRTQDGKSERPDLAARTITPDVLYQSHSAALGLAFCDNDTFPPSYQRGAFSVFRGSWNRDEGTGYKVVFVPFLANKPSGYYIDFVTGFLLKPDVPETCARPVGCAFKDGALLFTDEGNGRVYRVSYEK